MGIKGWAITHIRSGPAWPQGLAPIDRLAALPMPEGGAFAWLPDDAILSCEFRSSEVFPLCARDTEGSVIWAFDPARWIEGLLAERYVREWSRPLPSRVPLLNYNRLPNALKGVLQPTSRLDATRSNEFAFPDVPLDDLVERLRQLCTTLAFGAPPQTPALWPDGQRAAVTVCHDVDTGWILEPSQRALLDSILEAENEHGFRGAWYVTAQQLDRKRHAAAIEAILEAGHEIGAHGWKHDAKLDYLSADQQKQRMQLAKQRFEGIDVSGIRTPWYCRSPQLMQVLGRHFAYSSSVPNSSAFFSRWSNSGCCTVFPYRLEGGPIELPLTLPPDTAGEREALHDVLIACSERIIARGGVVVVTLHPQPHQSGNREGIAAHGRLLRDLEGLAPGQLWKATPHEIVAHYRDAISAPSRPVTTT